MLREAIEALSSIWNGATDLFASSHTTATFYNDFLDVTMMEIL